MVNKISQKELKIKFRERLITLMGEMTQSDVERKTGISRQIIAKYTSGKALPNTYTLYLLADFFGVSCDYLLGIHDGSQHDNQYVIDRTGLNEESLKALESFKTDDEWKFELFAINSLIKYEKYNGRKFLVSLGKYISSPNLEKNLYESIYSLILPQTKVPEITYIGARNNDFFMKKEYFKIDDLIYHQMIKEFNLLLDDIKNDPHTKYELLKHIIDIINPYYDEALDCLFKDGNLEDGTEYDKATMQHAMETYLHRKMRKKILKHEIRLSEKMLSDMEETLIDNNTQSEED